MNQRLSDIQTKIKSRRNTQEKFLILFNEYEGKLKDAKRRRRITSKAQEIIKKASYTTQKQFELNINSIVTSALNGVFDEPNEFVMEFIEKNEKTICDLYFIKNGKKLDPVERSGFGAINIASLALRIAVWFVSETPKRNVLFVDEPLRDLSVGLLNDANFMLRQIINKIGLQIIMISHDPNAIDYADNVFNTGKINAS